MRIMLPICWLLVIPGCAHLVKPDLGPELAIAKSYDDKPSLQNAMKVGVSMRDRYIAKVEDQIAFDRRLAIGLVGGSAVAADMAMRSVGKSAILGLGLVGAASYTGAGWLSSKPQQRIYAAGANAVQCALDAMHPLVEPSANIDRFAAEIALMQTEADSVAALLPPGPPKSAAESRGAILIRRANALRPVALAARQRLAEAGPALRTSLSAIQLRVTDAIVDNTPSLDRLVADLGRSLPALSGNLVGSADVKGAQVDSKLVKTSSPALDTANDRLEAVIRSVIQRSDQVNIPPRLEQLRLCNVDLSGAGLAMKVTPASDVTLVAGGTANAMVSGGQPPYAWTWNGPAPGAGDVTVSLESGIGAVMLMAKAGATAGDYKMIFSDRGSGSAYLHISVVPATAKQAPAPPGKKKAVSEASADLQLKQAQQALIDMDIKTVKIRGEDRIVVADGIYGEITEAAMREFFRRQGAKNEDEIPRGEQLLKEAKSELLLKKKEK